MAKVNKFGGWGVLFKAAKAAGRKDRKIAQKMLANQFILNAGISAESEEKKQFINFKRNSQISLTSQSRRHILFGEANWIDDKKGVGSTKAKTIQRLKQKARLVEVIVKSENYMLRHKSNFQREDPSETKYKDFHGEKWLNSYTKKELDIMERVINNELSMMGITSQRQVHRAIVDAEYRYQKISTLAYNDFMDNWKNGFWAYKPEELGMSEDQRNNVWKQIEQEKDYGWWQEKYEDFDSY